jgi:acyl carrier protein
MKTHDETQLLQALEKAVSIVLNLNGRSLSASTMLIGDLGAESIDLLDISCEMEKLVDLEVDFRKVFLAKRALSQQGVIDVSLGEIVQHLGEQSMATGR